MQAMQIAAKAIDETIKSYADAGVIVFDRLWITVLSAG